MANFDSKEELKFNLDAFRELHAPDLIINIWTYNKNFVHKSKCAICKTYCDYSTQALREKWKAEWGDFEFVTNKFKKCDKNFINIERYSSANMHLIIDFLKKIQQKNFF